MSQPLISRHQYDLTLTPNEIGGAHLFGATLNMILDQGVIVD